jgi:hypothetical protein
VTLEQWQDDPDPQILQALRIIARLVGVGGGAALGYLVYDSTGAVGAMTGEAFATALERGVDRTMKFQVNQAGKMVLYAAEEAQLSADELIDAAADPHRLNLLSQALSAAAATALESKLKVLGRLLVQGLLNDDQAQIDEARLLTAAIEEIERPHLRILNYIEKPYDQNHRDDERANADADLPPEAEIPPDAWTLDRLRQELRSNRSVVQVIIGTLSGRTLIRNYADTYGPPLPEVMQWTLTDPGKAVLQIFREAGEAAAGTPAMEQEERGPQERAGELE